MSKYHAARPRPLRLRPLCPRPSRPVAEPLESRRLLATFNAAVSVSGLAATPRHVATADFNNDGFADFAVVNNAAAGAVAVRLGTGTAGTFTAAASVTVGANPFYVAVADFNNDGRTDLATANNNASGTVSVALGNGNGTFAAAVTVAVGPNPFSVAAGDFNNDGKIDLIAPSATGNVVYRAFGNGNGTFGTPTVYSAGGQPYEIVVADFDSNGNADIALTNSNSSGTVAVRLGDGAGGFGAFTAFTVGSLPTGLAVGDFNKDGKLDLAAANQSGNTVSVLLNAGSGSFGTASTFSVGTGPTSVAAGDFDFDGDLDLVTANSTASTVSRVSLLDGDGSGGFASGGSFAVPNGAATLAAGDFNADARPDLIVGTASGTAVTLLPGNGTQQFALTSLATLAGGSTPFAVVAADFNEDGRVDTATANSATASVSVLIGDGGGGFATPTSVAVGGNAFDIVSADFNGDGLADLATANDNSISILKGNGNGTFAVSTIGAGTARRALAVGDFNGDGRPDLAVVNTAAGTVSVLLGNGDGTFAIDSSGAGGVPTDIAVADFDGDGRDDLAIANFVTNGLVTLRRGLGDGTFATAVTYAAGAKPYTVAAADFNGDGRPDLATASRPATSPTLGTISVLKNNGSGAFPAVVNYPAGRNPFDLKAADLDGDGAAELVASNADSNALSLYANDGRGVFRGGGVSLGNGQAASTVSDFNGDGRADLAVLSVSGVVSVLLGQRAFRSGYAFASGGTLTLNGNTFGGDPSAYALDYDPARDVVTVVVRGLTDRLLGTALRGVTAYAFAYGTVNFDLGRLGGGRPADAGVANGSKLTFTTSQHLGALTGEGEFVLPAGGDKVLTATGFAFDPAFGQSNVRIDLNDNAMVLNYATAGTAAIDKVRAAVALARNGGAWNGKGLTSTSARNNAAKTTALGYLEATDYKAINGATTPFYGEPLDDTAVVLRYTLYGDTDLDRDVDIGDFNRLAVNFGGVAGKTWLSGDFDYNAGTLIGDFNLLAIDFGKTLIV